MTSALNNKINSYTLKRGIEFSEAVSNTPTRTGSNSLGTFVHQNITYEATNGPLNGQGSWKFGFGTGLHSYLECTNPNTTELDDGSSGGTFDKNWSMGFWFNISEFPDNTSQHIIMRFADVSSPTGTVGGTRINFVKVDSTLGYLRIRVGTQTYDLSSFGIVKDLWYYFAAIRNGNYLSFYINGTLVDSTVHYNSGTGNPDMFVFGNEGTPTCTTGIINFSNFYWGTASNIPSSAIMGISATGFGEPIKYWEGNFWLNAIDKKVWNGSAWVPWTASYWDGANWISL